MLTVVAVITLIAWAIQMVRSRFLNPASYVAAAVIFYGLLPSLIIYSGVVEPQTLVYQRYFAIFRDVGPAVLLEVVAVWACIGGGALHTLVRGSNRVRGDSASPVVLPGISFLNVAYVGYIALAATLFAVNLPKYGLNKAVVIASAPLHYQFLAVSICIFATLLLIKTRLQWQLFAACGVVFLGYCLITDERDFVLYGIVGVVALTTTRQLKIDPWLIGCGVTLLLALNVILGSARAESDFLAEFASGSVSLIDFLVTSSPLFTYSNGGSTFIESIARAFGFGGGTQSLSDQFVGIVSEGGGSGYGFSLVAESYLNGGMLTVVLFLAGGCVVLNTLRYRLDTSITARFYYVLLLVLAVNAIRNDSQGLVSGLLFGSVFYGLLRLGSALLAKDEDNRPASDTSTRESIDAPR